MHAAARSLWLAIVVMAVAVIGDPAPDDAGARSPDSVKAWGCTFTALPLQPGSHVRQWWGELHIDCGRRHLLDLSLSIFEDRPGRNRLVSKFHWENRYGRWFGERVTYLSTVTGGQCRRRAEPPPHPFYFRAKVTRFWKPGTIYVASSSDANPCPKGYWPVPERTVVKDPWGRKPYFGPPLIKRGSPAAD